MQLLVLFTLSASIFGSVDAYHLLGSELMSAVWRYSFGPFAKLGCIIYVYFL